MVVKEKAPLSGVSAKRAVAVVNDSPVGCQSRDRARHSELAKIGSSEPIFD